MLSEKNNAFIVIPNKELLVKLGVEEPTIVDKLKALKKKFLSVCDDNEVRSKNKI